MGVGAGSEAVRAIEDVRELADVVKRDEDVATADGSGFVVFARATTNGPDPKSGSKTVEPLQHPTPAPYPSDAEPQHQIRVAWPLTVGGQAYILL